MTPQNKEAPAGATPPRAKNINQYPQYSTTRRISRFQEELSQAPTPGGGGCHAWLLRAANLAALAAITPDDAAQAIHAAIPHGGRNVPMREVRDAVTKAYKGRTNGDQHIPPPRRPKPPIIDSEAFFQCCLEQHPDPFTELWKTSPVRLRGDVNEDPALLLSALYSPDEKVYIGGAQNFGRPGNNIRTVADWLELISKGGKPGPHWIPNPLTGAAHQTKDGKQSFRCDSAISSHRFCVLEFDNLPKATQAAFWLSARLPLAAIIDTGGKSLHGILKVDCVDSAEWEREIEQDFFPRIVVALGGDKSCKNESRMSRIPGVKRGEYWQRLLYLDPDARGIKR